MARITVEDCLEREPNRFALVILSAKRAKQILQGSSILSSEERGNKPVVMALREVADGHVRFMTEEDRAKLEELRAQQAEDAPESEELLGASGGSLIMPRPVIADIADSDDDEEDSEEEGEDEEEEESGSRNGERPHD